MSTKAMYAVSGAIAAFVTNLILHVFIIFAALRMAPPNFLVAAVCIPFLPVWIIVIFGLAKMRKWSVQIGIVTSLLAVILSVAGHLLGWTITIVTFTLDLLQIIFCTYLLKKI